MPEHDDKIEKAIDLLREPVTIDPSLDLRVMAEINEAPQPRKWLHRIWASIDWVVRGRPVSVSPLGGFALAATVAVLVLWGRVGPSPEVDAAPQLTTVDGASVQFVIVAPAAREVSLVGDFNDWNPAATRMQLVAENMVWSVTVPLTAGRYRYAFLVDGDTWLSDPSAPPVRDDEFGRPGSVVTIGET